MGYKVLQPHEHAWVERPATEFTDLRYVVDLTPAGALEQSRARLWKLPPRSRGRRHSEAVQEEVFVVISGTLTVLLDDPPERAEVIAGGVVTLAPGTAIQLRNESDDDCVLFAYGAPPVAGQAEYLDDVPI